MRSVLLHDSISVHPTWVEVSRPCFYNDLSVELLQIQRDGRPPLYYIGIYVCKKNIAN